MKRIVYILFIYPIVIGFSLTLNAQEYFNNTYVQPNINGSRSVVELDTNYIVVGQQPTTVQRKMLFYNIKKTGDTNWVREYYDSLKIFYAMKALSKNNELFVFGAMLDSADIDNTDLFLASFDMNANLNWLKRYGGAYFDNGLDFKFTADGGFILSGSQSPDSNNVENFYLVKTDSFGNIEWEQTYGGGQIDVAISIVITSDDGYLFSGYSKSYSPSYDCIVMKVDSTGNEQWTKTFGTNLDDNGGTIIELNDHSYLLTTVFEISSNNHIAQIIKLDLNGEIIWQKQHVNSSYSSLHIPLLNVNDGTIIFGGGVKNSMNRFDGYVLKLDPIGNEIWRREYAFLDYGDQYIYDLKFTSDSGYIFCGSAFDSSFIQRAWVVKLDCFGCDSILCYYPDSVCDVYDCTQFPISADFTVSDYSINLAYGEDTVSFVNNSMNTTNRVWSFGNDSIAYTDSVFTQSYTTIGTYDVSLIVYHGMCSDTVVQTITVVDDLGLTEWEREWERVLIYPNPNSGTFTISNHTNQAFDVEVTDALGKLVYQGKVEKKIEQFQLHLDNGIYTGRFSQNGYQYQQKIIIQK